MKVFKVIPTGSDGLASRDAEIKSWDVVDDYFVHFSVNSPDEANSLIAGLILASSNFEFKIKEAKSKKYELRNFVMHTHSNLAQHMADNMGAWRAAPEESQTAEPLVQPSNENKDTNKLESTNTTQKSPSNMLPKGNK